MVHYNFATAEQIELADNARKILERELAPRLDELEHAGKYPRDVHKLMADAGYVGMGIGEHWGGLGFDLKTQALIYEEMAQVDAGFSFSLALASAVDSISVTGMPVAEKQMWHERVLSGDAITATCLTETGAGSDEKAIRTKADLVGDEYVINGTKCFITNGGCADLFTVSALVDEANGKNSIATFIVEKDRGVQIGKTENKLGLKLSETSEVIFDDVHIPADHLVGSIAKFDPAEASRMMKANPGMVGYAGIMRGLAVARITSMTHALGIAQRAMDEAVEYAKVRRQFGKRIIDHQGLGFKIADMQMKLDAARALLYYAVDTLDAGKDVGTLSSSTKVYVSEVCMEITLDAVQVLGGYGYMHDYPVEKLMRDAKIFSIFEGTNEINKYINARLLAGKDSEAKKR